MANFEPIVEWILYQEDDRKVPGKIVDLGDGAGLTRLGITQRNFGRLLPASFWSTMDFHSAVAYAKSIYQNQFWHFINGEQINDNNVAATLMSAAVNEGIAPAVKMLQNVLGVNEDGILGLITTNELNSKDPVIVNKLLRAVWVEFYQRLVSINPSKQRFLDQWLVRAQFPFPSPLVVGSLYGS